MQGGIIMPLLNGFYKKFYSQIMGIVLVMFIFLIVLGAAINYNFKEMSDTFVIGTCIIFIWNYASWIHAMYRYNLGKNNNIVDFIFSTGSNIAAALGSFAILYFYFFKIDNPLENIKNMQAIIILGMEIIITLLAFTILALIENLQKKIIKGAIS